MKKAEKKRTPLEKLCLDLAEADLSDKQLQSLDSKSVGEAQALLDGWQRRLDYEQEYDNWAALNPMSADNPANWPPKTR